MMMVFVLLPSCCRYRRRQRETRVHHEEVSVGFALQKKPRNKQQDEDKHQRNYSDTPITINRLDRLAESDTSLPTSSAAGCIKPRCKYLIYLHPTIPSAKATIKIKKTFIKYWEKIDSQRATLVKFEMKPASQRHKQCIHMRVMIVALHDWISSQILRMLYAEDMFSTKFQVNNEKVKLFTVSNISQTRNQTRIIEAQEMHSHRSDDFCTS